MIETKDADVIVLGAGLAGSLLAVYLGRRGLKVKVFERRPDPRKAGYAGGRSINLALSHRGIWGLSGVGLEGAVLKHALPMRGRIMHPVKGDLAFQPYSADPSECINSISRGALNIALLDAAERTPGVTVEFGREAWAYPSTEGLSANDWPSRPIDKTSAGNLTVGRLRAPVYIATDGAYSFTRHHCTARDRVDYSQSYLGHGYKELHIPSAADLGLGSGHDGWALDPQALHIWPRGGAMMIALPNPDRTFTCTLFWPWEGPHSFANLKSDADVGAFFERHYPDVPPLMPTLAADFAKNPTSSLVTIRCWPWVWSEQGSSVALLGDAAHAIVPFYGQGMNAAFEDVRVLDDCIGRRSGLTPEALDEYQRLRKPNADAIADMALDNFVEMRDKVGSPAFLYKKRLEQLVHTLAPDRFTPQYNLVSFSTVPYAEAQRRGRELDHLLERLIPVIPADKAASMGEAAWKARVAALLHELAPR
jgi:kynurenine 3-monooxygenase